MSKIIKLQILHYFLIKCILLHSVYAHSWLHCVDYDQSAPLNVRTIQNNLCGFFPRGITASTVFGVDYGFDHNPSNAVCKFPQQNDFRPVYKNKKYRILWPAKNHQSDVCTNSFIPDTRLQMFAFKVESRSTPDPVLSTWATAANLFFDIKKENGKGFQNCPDFCSDTDKAPCFADINYNNIKGSGFYRILWLWEFNQNQLYSHCYDIELIDQSNSTPITINDLRCFRCAQLV